MERRAVHGCDEDGQAHPKAAFALVLAEESYTANAPLVDLLRSNILFASGLDASRSTRNMALQLVVPRRSAWKSVKWVRGFMLLDGDRLGFSESDGYHAMAIHGKSSAIREARCFEGPTELPRQEREI
jgi:DMSO/TMAO reductase YedYZ molybdopterin-dependent catalytic subunit